MATVSDCRTRHLLVYVAILAFVAFLGARWLQRDGAPATAEGEPAPGIQVRTSGGGRVTVHVAGAVQRPGVYRLVSGARVHQAVDRAGGPTRRADTTQINLAAKVEDGRQVLVPERAPAPGAPGASNAATVAAPPSPVNLNTATVEQLDALDGIGPATAQQIIDFRDANDGFGSVEELGDVPGIGDKRLATLREQVRV
ncbi:MAG: hypothetical protein AVDCRST_MAG69-2387 [uncultured Solirubrobacteraceae bacterium]|uniref:Helix-hairpin-helix DNA-binding motif class 1 domain-containing protein n=1 Tax=uncultured Solirubrobacteraceae bacterium TaxID=1162706 RepID=A0A6J4SZ17_9ACTN|nr:MAG: hypothetical protein AVDCRST_MAG69-2387 [uncultured Solirubrobacteraceae bacterium]